MQGIGWIYIAVSVIAWSISPSLIALDRGRYNSIAANASRSLYAALFMLPYLILIGYVPSANDLLMAVLVGITGAVVGDTAYVAALRCSSPGLVIPVSYTYVFVAQIIGVFIGTSIDYMDIVASLVAVLGVYIAYSGSRKTSSSLKGLVYSVVASFSWGVFVHLVNYAVSVMDPIVLNFLRLLVTSAVLFIVSLILYGSRNSLPALYRLRYTNLSGILGFGVGGTFFYLALSVLEFSPAIITTALTPLTAVFTAKLLLKEEIRLKHVIGTLVVVGAIVLSTI